MAIIKIRAAGQVGMIALIKFCAHHGEPVGEARGHIVGCCAQFPDGEAHFFEAPASVAAALARAGNSASLADGLSASILTPHTGYPAGAKLTGAGAGKVAATADLPGFRPAVPLMPRAWSLAIIAAADHSTGGR